MTNRTLLALVAHPDDEVMTGGTLAKYAHEGARVVLVCATRGEVGEISDPSLATVETLADVRTDEVYRSAAALGINEVRFLGFRDSGMAGTPPNDDPSSFNQTSPDEAVGRIVALLREIRPDVVFTHDPTGGYGHPDHLACYHYMTAAVAASGDPDQFSQAGPPWTVQRLYWMVNARSFFLSMREQMAAAGIENDWGELDLDRFGYTDDQITTVIYVGDYLDAKNGAFRQHRTQFGDDNTFNRLPQDFMRDLMSREHFILAHPPPPAGTPPSTDLFESL